MSASLELTNTFFHTRRIELDANTTELLGNCQQNSNIFNSLFGHKPKKKERKKKRQSSFLYKFPFAVVRLNAARRGKTEMPTRIIVPAADTAAATTIFLQCWQNDYICNQRVLLQAN